MRVVYLALIVLFAAITVIFAFQNLQLVTISFLGLSVRLPFAITIAAFYLAGAVTGGGLFALLRRSYVGSRRAAPAP